MRSCFCRASPVGGCGLSGGLSDADLLAGGDGAAGRQAVELLDRTGADAVGLAHGVGRFALPCRVGRGVALPAPLLAGNEDRFAGDGLHALLQLVELAQVARRDAEAAADRLERVVLLGQDVVHAVGFVDVVAVVGVDRYAVVVRVDERGRWNRGVRHAALVVEAAGGIGVRRVARRIEPAAVGAVEQVELVLLDDADEPLRVVGRRGVAGGLQSARPVLVVGGAVGEERVVAGLGVEEFGVVAVRSLDRRVAAEAFALRVVVVIDLRAGPAALALDAEVVVRVARQQAVARVRFEQPLGHGDAGRDAVALHVLHGDRLVAVDVLLLGDAALGACRENRPHQEKSGICCFSRNIH